MIGMLCTLALIQAPKLSRVWSMRLQTEVRSVVVGERAIYFGTNDSFGAIDQATGTKIWAKSFGLPQIRAYVAQLDNVLFASVGQGNLSAFDAANGRPIWIVKQTGYSSPIGAYNQAVYGSLATGKLTALSAGNGKPIWTADLQKSDPSTKPIRYGKDIFVGTKLGSVFALDKDTGHQTWRFKERNAGVQSLLVMDDRLLAFFDDGAIFAISLATGQKMWSVYTNNGLFGTPLVKEGRLYVTSVGGGFYSIAGLNGDQLWKRPLSFLQNFGLSQPMSYQDGFLLADRSKLVYLNSEGEKQWEVETGSDLFGQQPRPLGDDILLTGSHEIRRVRLFPRP
jgi:outer membrane protein assembly factor BamB